MSAALVLRVLDIPGLQRRCVPVYESGASGIEGCRGLLAPRVSNSAECVVRWEDRAAGMETGITGGTAVDLTHPFGRYHALLWLRERGHDLRWAEDEPEVLAWSVLSVSRGGGPIVDVLHPWRMAAENDADTGATWVRHRAFDPKNRGGGLWACDTLQVWRAFGWENSLVPAGPGCPWVWLRGPETGDLGRAAADAAALAHNYALRTADGITLPALPGEETKR